ncbi:ester cyclase [Jannaschia sp. Os4]|uniref:ester cyclase n=1 Tax=Jannaschia sp. Os4 TaxID=2807617 RepID=UPI001939C5EE|nr:ester cyclase [Jannaschia sp. Os4]MBM2577436.1 ester cyclase [Jannaschia sp. Os4]
MSLPSSPALAASVLGLGLMAPVPAFANEAAEMIRAFYAAVDRGDRDAYAAMIDDGFEDHDRPAAAPPAASDAQVVLDLFSELATGFPGAVHTLDLIEPISPDADGNPRAMVRWTFEGDHKGAFFGISASGNAVSITGIDVFAARDGRFVEQWHVEELAQLFAQIDAR